MIPISPDIAVVIAGHGSRDPEGVSQFETFVDLVRKRVPGRIVTHGYLEFALPTIDQGVRTAIEAGARRVAVVPSVLLGATHAKNDMPVEVLALQREFPGIEIQYGAPMHLHPSVLQLCRVRIVEAESAAPRLVARTDTCLILVGRGTTDPDANSDVNKLARMLEEGMGFGASFVCYSGTAKPGLADGLRAAGRLGFARLLVLPFFLFTGVLIKRIQSAVNDLQLSRPEQEVLCAEYLGAHALTADALLDRAREAFEGKAHMNCSLCKYRTTIIGYEAETGTPQQGHHFHVRGGGPTATGTQPVARAVTSGGTPDSGSRIPASTSPSTPQEETPHPETRHPIEVESFRIIEEARDWSAFDPLQKSVLQRLVHTAGDFGIVDDVFFSTGAPEAGVRAALDRCVLLTDVTMVQSGLRRSVVAQLGLRTACLVHDEETRLVADANRITRSAAGIRRGWLKYGNEVVVLVGDAPTAVEETARLIREQNWRPRLVIALPVGFVGTRECKETMRRCLHVPRITNCGTRGGSPWAAAAMNALLLHAAETVNRKVAARTA
jgi:precorrin-8X/cobalt-precorrin-8 methylmutase